eukprot:CAMPEP_0179339850 /NCGR_PEP_ID=MMETSP0797-20121207/68949_1 /TAXON_ID=47934 /ORGANISM="Dinophysis acuminata, Strain DAEP01" /LENGTH=101 /DNA_ID=CAMNT_0021053737 /DNA_START=407 /DNA_END=708 /DNA_ORIENTATION=-
MPPCNRTPKSPTTLHSNAGRATVAEQRRQKHEVQNYGGPNSAQDCNCPHSNQAHSKSIVLLACGRGGCAHSPGRLRQLVGAVPPVQHSEHPVVAVELGVVL